MDAMANVDGNLKNIATGLIEPENVSIMEVKDMGMKIISEMAGNSVPTHSFKKSMQAVPIPAKQSRKRHATFK